MGVVSREWTDLTCHSPLTPGTTLSSLYAAVLSQGAKRSLTSGHESTKTALKDQSTPMFLTTTRQIPGWCWGSSIHSIPQLTCTQYMPDSLKVVLVSVDSVQRTWVSSFHVRGVNRYLYSFWGLGSPVWKPPGLVTGCSVILVIILNDLCPLHWIITHENPGNLLLRPWRKDVIVPWYDCLKSLLQ